MRSIFNLLQRNYKPVSLSELEAYYYEGKDLENCCHITFDDGDVSFYQTVFPIVKEMKLPVSIYVSPKATTERNNFWFQEIRGYDKPLFKKIVLKVAGLNADSVTEVPLTAILKSLKIDKIWEAIELYRKETGTPPKECINMDTEQLLEVYGTGLVDIGAHTMTHPILKNENDERADAEIKESVQGLGKLLGIKMEYFAYPNGVPGLDFGEREMKFLEECGVKLAFSTENDRFKKTDNPLSIPRNGITYGSNLMIKTKLVMGGKWDKIKKVVKGKGESEWRKILLSTNDTYEH